MALVIATMDEHGRNTKPCCKQLPKDAKVINISCLFHDRRLLVSLQDEAHTKMNERICSNHLKER